MRVTVHLDVCEYHGQCAIVAPRVFTLKDRETLVWAEEPEPDDFDAVELAAAGCPTQAIEILDESV